MEKKDVNVYTDEELKKLYEESAEEDLALANLGLEEFKRMIDSYDRQEPDPKS